MILVDTSVWIDHLHHADERLTRLLGRGDLLTHPMVIGELAVGTLRDRDGFLALISALPEASPASHEEVMLMVDQRALHGIDLSLVDAHLLASTLITPAARLWTRDRRLSRAAAALGVGARR